MPAADGKWDGMAEETSVSFIGLPPGATTIKFRARNQVGMYSDEYVKVVYYLGVHFAELQALARPSHNLIKWQVVGEDFGSRFDVYRLLPGEDATGLYEVEPGEEFPGTLVASDVQPASPGSGFVPYEFRDADVQPGVRYRYFVNASGEVVFEGDTHHFNSPSNVVAQVAMLPVPGGSFLSQVSPNPFRSEASLSINVPPTYVRETAGDFESAYDRRVATELDVTVYDVLGRAVRTLHHRSGFEEVITVKWDGTTDSGARASSGVYFMRVQAGSLHEVRKVLLVR
jgi:hypothetical protein